MIEEVLEQEEEHAGVHADPPDESDRVLAWVVEEKLEGVRHDGDELNHLHDCQVLLPPQVLLHGRAHGGEHVVSVHHDVDSRVDEAEERRVTAGGEFDAPPNCLFQKEKKEKPLEFE